MCTKSVYYPSLLCLWWSSPSIQYGCHLFHIKHWQRVLATQRQMAIWKKTLMGVSGIVHPTNACVWMFLPACGCWAGCSFLFFCRPQSTQEPLCYYLLMASHYLRAILADGKQSSVCHYRAVGPQWWHNRYFSLVVVSTTLRPQWWHHPYCSLVVVSTTLRPQWWHHPYFSLVVVSTMLRPQWWHHPYCSLVVVSTTLRPQWWHHP